MLPFDILRLALLGCCLAVVGCNDATTVRASGISGGPFDDILIGSSADDHLRGFGGNDILDGRSGDDLLDGGSGADHLDGGTGIDTATYINSSFGVDVDLTANFQSGGQASGDSLEDIENITGSSADDRLAGDALPNRLIGGNGDDELIGRDGNDDLDGGPGNDHISGGQGADFCRGGSGFDNMSFDRDDLLLDGGSHDDTLLIQDDLVLSTASAIIRDIEVANLQDSLANTLSLGPDDVEDVTDNRITLRIFGDAGIDGVLAPQGPGTWTFTGTVTIGGQNYNQYEALTSGGDTATLQVFEDLNDLGL